MDDEPDVFKADAITLLYVPSAAAQTTTSSAMTDPSSPLTVNAGPECPPAAPVCGFVAGMSAVVYDATGAFDTFEVTDVANGSMQIEHAQQRFCRKPIPLAQQSLKSSSTYSRHVHEPADALRRFPEHHACPRNVVGLNWSITATPAGRTDPSRR
jgi:hypothetical protein